MFAASLVLVAAVYGLAQSAWNTDSTGAYISFLSALGVWGWIEMSFLMGIITGPRTAPCPEDAIGWKRFRMALQTLLYHELTIAAAAVAITIFLGVPKLTDEFLPKRLAYLKSYFRKREVNLLFPVTVGAATLMAAVLAESALGTNGAEAISFALLFSLLALAILEHLFMILPLPDATLWRWALRSASTSPTTNTQ
jgi:hypothetical protein